MKGMGKDTRPLSGVNSKTIQSWSRGGITHGDKTDLVIHYQMEQDFHSKGKLFNLLINTEIIWSLILNESDVSEIGNTLPKFLSC